MELEMFPRQNMKLNEENMFQSNHVLTQDFVACVAHSHHPRCTEGTGAGSTRISGLSPDAWKAQALGSTQISGLSPDAWKERYWVLPESQS